MFARYLTKLLFSSLCSVYHTFVQCSCSMGSKFLDMLSFLNESICFIYGFNKNVKGLIRLVPRFGVADRHVSFFLFGSSAISDTCMAMGEWVDNPHAESALSNILPCVDPRTTNQTLFKSKQVTVGLVNIVNGFIDTYANSNPSNHLNSNYYNQSGPVIPHLCYPYDSQLQDLPCPADQVSMANSSMVSINVSLLPLSPC